MQLPLRTGGARALLAIGLALAACTDSPTAPAPEPGELIATLQSPNGAEGATVVQLSGTGLGAVRADSAGLVFSERQGDLTRVALVLPTPGAVRFRVQVPNVHTPPSATVLEVAGADNQLRGSLSGYSVRFSRGPR